MWECINKTHAHFPHSRACKLKTTNSEQQSYLHTNGKQKFAILRRARRRGEKWRKGGDLGRREKQTKPPPLETTFQHSNWHGVRDGESCRDVDTSPRRGCTAIQFCVIIKGRSGSWKPRLPTETGDSQLASRFAFVANLWHCSLTEKERDTISNKQVERWAM